jgi:hypothetical protein
MDAYRVRFRDRQGREERSIPQPTLAAAVAHAGVIALHGGRALGIIGPDGEIPLAEAEELVSVATTLKPPI